MEYGDIYNYLIDLPGPYTKEKHTSHLRLTISTLVAMYDPLCIEISLTSSSIILFTKVKSSQKSASNPHNAWVLMKRNGLIVTGHCTCMAG